MFKIPATPSVGEVSAWYVKKQGYKDQKKDSQLSTSSARHLDDRRVCVCGGGGNIILALRFEPLEIKHFSIQVPLFFSSLPSTTASARLKKPRTTVITE